MTESPNVIELQENSRVSVLWKETGQSFEGTVAKTHSDGSYDIVYDEMIQGSICRENHVTNERITLLNVMEQDDIYWKDSHNVTSLDQEDRGSDVSIIARPALPLPYSLEHNPVVEKICKVNDVEERVNLSDLDDNDVTALFDAISLDKLLNLGKSAPSKLRQIFQAFVTRLEKFENISGIAENVNIVAGEFDVEVCKEITILMRCIIAVIRINTILNSDRVSASDSSVPIPEEFFEKVLRFLHSFFSTNLSDVKRMAVTNVSSRSKERASPVSPVKESKFKGTDAASKRFIQFLCTDFLHLTSSFLDVLQIFLNSSKPSSTVLNLLIDFSFDVLRLDPLNNPIVNVVDIRMRSQLVYLFKSAVVVVRLLYSLADETFRGMIEQQIIQRLRDSYENKNPYRPLLVDQRAVLSHDQSTITSITTGTYCMLSCIQALIKSPIAAQKALTVRQEKKGSESDQIASKANTAILSKPATSIEPEDMMSDCYLLISNILVLLFQYCSNNKDLSAEYYQVFMQLLQECLTAAISPLWPSAGIFAEKAIYSLFVQLKKSVEEGVVSNESSSSKREIYHINQIIDILSALGEQMSFIQKDNQQASLPADLLNELLAVSVNPANFDGRSEEAKAFTLQSFIVQLIRLKWKQVQPLWSKLLSETEASDEPNDIYWENDLSSPTKVSPLKKKNSASSNSPTELLPYLKQLDSLIEINSDVLDLLEERMTSFDCSKQIAQLVENGAIDATLLLLPTIHESQNLSRLLEEVTDVDIKYGRLLRFIIEQHGGYRFNEVDPFHQSPDDLQHRDACLFTISFWAQYKKYHQRRQESCPALLQLAVHLTENQMTNANNPNFIQKTVLPYFIQERKIQSHKLSEDLTRSIIVQRTFKPLLSKLLEALLYMIGDTSPLVRARSVKALSKFIHSNLEKILQDNQGLCDTIVSILYDRSIAVREEGVKLIGPIIASGYSQGNIGNRLLEELKPLLLDEGISVRKSVVIIMRDILQNQPIHVQYIDLCARLLERLSAPKEEESIKETICAIFQQIWFSPPSINAIQVMRNLFTSSSQIASTGNPYYQLGLLSRELSQGKSVGKEANLKDFKDFYVEFTALQLIEVSLMDVSHAWILTLLQELLHQKEKGNETSSTAKQRREASFQHCEKIVAFMKELLILIEENHHTAVINFLHARNFSPADYKVSIIATIALFCEAHPPFVSRHLLVFLPYLKGDSELSPAQNVAVCGYVMKILESVAVLEKSNLSFVNPDRIIEDLVTIAFTQSGKNISSSISCIASLIAYVTLDGVPFIKLAEKCFVSLTQTVQSLPTDPSKIDQLHPQQSARLQRCLVIYGYLCEHSRKCKTILLKLPSNYLKELEPDSTLFKKHLIALNERVAQMSFREVTGFDPRLFYGIGYSVVMYSLSLPDPAVQLRAIQCLCGIFAGYPRIMLLAKEKEHIRQVLSDRFNETLHERFLIGLKEMMVSEEQQLEKKASIQQMKESGVGISKRTTVLGGAVDHDSDATIAGFVLQQYHKDLTEFLKKPSISLRYCTLQLFATLLRQGMICPLDILALAVMLLGDENEEIRQESLILLQIQDERHPNFLDSRLIEGIEAAHDFQLQTFNHLTPVLPKQRDLDTSHSIFSSLYLTCIVPNKKRKIQFLYGLLRRCISTVIDATALLSAQEEGGGISSPMKSAVSSLPSPQGKPLSALSIKKNTSSNKSKDGDGASAKVTEKNFLDQLDRLGKKFSKVRYYAMTLATLPFVSIDEVLYIIHWIGRTVPTDCVIVLKKLESIYAQLGIIGAGGTSNTPKQTKSEEGNAKTESSDPLNHMMRLDEVKWRGIIDPLIQGGASHSTIYQTMYEMLSHHYQLRCEEILIRLKSYFKIIYNLSDEKCQNFDPNDKSSAAFSSSEKLNNDRYFDFQLSSADSNPVENHVTKERLIAIVTAGRGREKEKDREAVLLQRETVWRDVFLHCLQDYHRVHHIIHTDGDDFKLESHLSSTGTNQRRRKTASTPVASNAESKISQSASGKKRKAIKGSATKKTPTKRKKLNFDEDDDGDDVDMDVDDDGEDAEFELAEEKSKKRQKTAVASSTLSPAVTPSTRSSRRGVPNPATSAIAQHVKQHPQHLFADDA